MAKASGDRLKMERKHALSAWPATGPWETWLRSVSLVKPVMGCVNSYAAVKASNALNSKPTTKLGPDRVKTKNLYTSSDEDGYSFGRG